jgi:hypothetical protein
LGELTGLATLFGFNSCKLSSFAIGFRFLYFSRMGREGISASDLSPMKKLGMSERELSTESSKEIFWRLYLLGAFLA